MEVLSTAGSKKQAANRGFTMFFLNTCFIYFFGLFVVFLFLNHSNPEKMFMSG